MVQKEIFCHRILSRFFGPFVEFPLAISLSVPLGQAYFEEQHRKIFKYYQQKGILSSENILLAKKPPEGRL